MRIAVTYDYGEVFQHFGHTEQFKLYEVEDGKVISSEVIGSNGAGHGALAGLLAGEGISVSAMMQKDAAADGKATLIVITHVASEKAVQRVVKSLNPEICRVENVIRVEN